MGLRLELRVDRAHGRRHHKLTLEFSAKRVEVLVLFNFRVHHFGRDRSAGSGRPCFRIRDQRKMPRRNLIGFEQLIRPPPAKGPPRLFVNIRQPPGTKRFHGVVAGFTDVGRIRKSRAVHIRQVADDLHDMRVLLALVFELLDGGSVGSGPVCLWRRGPRNREHQRRQNREFHCFVHVRPPHPSKDSTPEIFEMRRAVGWNVSMRMHIAGDARRKGMVL
jgi:hypothetical protein